MPEDVKGLLAGLKPAERSVPICLRPDLLAELQEAQLELEAAQRTRSVAPSLAGHPELKAAAEKVEALRERMKAATLTFRLRALGGRGKAFRELQLAHPPRQGVERDKLVGFNEETLLYALVRSCVYEPVLDEDDWAALEQLSEGQWTQLTGAAWAVNAADVDIPFSRAASRVLQESDDT